MMARRGNFFLCASTYSFHRVLTYLTKIICLKTPQDLTTKSVMDAESVLHSALLLSSETFFILANIQ
jgi:hypothetical protein